MATNRWTDEDKSRLVGLYTDSDISVAGIAATLHRTTDSIRTMAYEIGVKRQARNIPDDTIFSNETPETAYWAGFLMADGGVSPQGGSFVTTLSLSSLDQEHLEAFNRFLGRSRPVRPRPNGECVVSVGSLRLANDLVRWGVVPNKTYAGSIPDDIPPQLLPHYTRGLVDGDGGIYICRCRQWTSWTVGLTNNASVIDRVASILKEHLDIDAYIFTEKVNERSRHITRGLKFSSKRDVRDAVIWMGYGGDGPALPRKREKALTIISTDPNTLRRHHPSRRFDSLAPSNDMEMGSS